MKLKLFVVATAVLFFYGVLYVLSVSVLARDLAAQEAINASLLVQVDSVRSERDALSGQIERDDGIFRTLFGEWNRELPVLSTSVTVTCYTSRPQETDDSPHVTADGSLVKRGVLAVSRDILEELGVAYGQRVFLEGYGVLEVRDTMAPRWRRRVDIWSSDLTAAQLHGKRENVAMLWQGR